ncbi:hypothetical protein JCM10212_005674 [Sporobolomyces blumeae]
MATDTTPVEQLSTDSTSTRPAWQDRYDSIASKLPDPISKRLPSADNAQSVLSTVQDNYSSLASATKKAGEAGKARYSRLSAETFTKKARSVTNESQVPVNVALGQVGPLMYETLLPGETFARRVPNVWYWLEVVPWTSPKTEYSAWDATWPILAVSGPSVALASLLAIPFVAVAAGGTALASLTSFGSTVAAGTTTAITSTSNAVTGSAAAAVSLATKASRIPGSDRVKTRLVDAAKKAVGNKASDRKLQESVVKYIVEATGGAGAASVAKGKAKEVGHVDEQTLSGEEKYLEEREKKKAEGLLDEVDVTGHEMDKVLKCETGDKEVDKALAKAFKRLTLKTTTYKTKNNPVLRLVGGPELETRESVADPRQFLVFYPFALLPMPNTHVEPAPLSEVPATLEEQELVRDARVVESFEDAEKAEKKLRTESSLHRSDSRDEVEVTEREEQLRKEQLDKIVEDALKADEKAGSKEEGKDEAATTTTTTTTTGEKKKWWKWT